MNELFVETLEHLEASLTCRHLGSALVPCKTVLPLDATDEAINAVAQTFGFSIVPLQQGPDCSFLDVSHVAEVDLRTGKVASPRRALADQHVARGDAPIKDALASLRRHRYLFLRNDGVIDQILAPSDLNKPAMRLYLTAKLMHLEWLVTETIVRALPTDAAWLSKVEPADADEIRRKFARMNARELDPRPIDFAGLREKLMVIYRTPTLRARLQPHTATDDPERWTRQALDDIVALRNKLAHGQLMLYDEEDVLAKDKRRCTTIEKLHRVVGTIDRWITRFAKALPPMPPSKGQGLWVAFAPNSVQLKS